jgi:hypothetical protein
LKRKIIVGALVVVCFLVLISVRVVTSSRTESLKGDKALKSGKTKVAIKHYRRSARWYAPGNPYVLKSYRALWHIGREAERQGDQKTALEAYRSIRGAILGCRSFYTPHAKWLPRVNRHIAQLMTAQQVKKGVSKELVNHHPAFTGEEKQKAGKKEKTGEDTVSKEWMSPREGRKKLEAWHLEQLTKTNAPSVGWSLLAILGLIVWIGGGFAFAYRAITPEDKLHARRAVYYGAVIILGLIVWMVGLYLA